MVQDKNEHNKIPEGDNNLDPSEMEKLRNDLKKEHNDAINLSKKSKAEILEEIEHSESHNQRELEQEMMRQTDFPKINPEKKSPEAQLSDMFHRIETDDTLYEYSNTLFPRFTQTCEQSKIGQNFPRDILALVLGMGDSLFVTLKLAKDAAIDALKIAYQPRVEFQRTKEIIS